MECQRKLSVCLHLGKALLIWGTELFRKMIINAQIFPIQGEWIMSMKTTGLVLAATAAVLFATATFADNVTSSQAASADVKCSGINACKGQGSCKSANNSCKGQNTCKGTGWSPTKSADECTKAGGTVIQ